MLFEQNRTKMTDITYCPSNTVDIGITFFCRERYFQIDLHNENNQSGAF